MKTSISILSLISVAVLLPACGKKEAEVPAPAPVKEDVASTVVVAEAMEEVDAIVEAAQEEVAETIGNYIRKNANAGND